MYKNLEIISKCLDGINFPIERMPKLNWAKRASKVILAVGGVGSKDDIKNISCYDDNRKIFGSRDIISLLNENWGENISRGSYDEVRRSCVKYLVEAGILWKNPDDINRSTNSPASGYALSKGFKLLVLAYNTKNWDKLRKNFLEINGDLREKFSNPNTQKKIIINIDEKILSFTPGAHNALQKIIIEEFLPRFSKGSELIYVGDSNNRKLHLDSKLANQLGIFELNHEQLPDVISYDRDNNWLFFIEAVASSGHISELRKLELDKLLFDCKVPVVMVSAFFDRKTMKKFLSDIAWETEVWIASDPSHLVHFNGNKFLGPYIKKS